MLHVTYSKRTVLRVFDVEKNPHSHIICGGHVGTTPGVILFIEDITRPLLDTTDFIFERTSEISS